ncbi:MAG: hypothetical protein IJA67_09245 [Oscillospiraceae bacterium]|nr:hypothetical protein [Oscillospiraceae bacterium]
MKKTISVVLTLVLMFSLSVTAFAASATTAPATDSADINATYVAGAAGGVVFSVDIEWTAMNFTYQAAGQPVWDPESHSYSESVPESWSGSGTVTITNHSNTALDVTPSYTMDSGYEATELNFTVDGEAVEGAVIVESAADTNAAVKKVITVTPKGKLASTADGKIGTVTVTVDESEYVSLTAANALLSDMRALEAMRGAEGNETTEEAGARATFNEVMMEFSGTVDDFTSGNITQGELNTKYKSALAYYNNYMADSTYDDLTAY